MHVLVTASAYLCRKKRPMLFLGVFWFYCGHLLESTVIPLELYYEHRNYLPILGILVMVCACGFRVSVHPIVRVALLLMIVLSSYFTHQKAKVWGDSGLQTVAWAIEHPASIRAQTDYVGLLLRQERYEEAFQLLSAMNRAWPSYFHINLLLIKYQCLNKFPSADPQSLLFGQEHSGVYSGNLPSALQALISTYKSGSCSRLDDERMIQLLNSLVGLKHSRPEFNAKIQMWKSEIYAKIGDLDGALVSVDNAIGYRKYSSYFYYKALLLESAGLYLDAYKAIKNAVRIELGRPIFLRAEIGQFEEVKTRLELYLESPDAKGGGL